jgi:hypothetical protein
VVELLRKLALTSIVALIAPGSGGQVVVGFTLATFTFILNLRMSPYASKGMNFVNAVAQARPPASAAARRRPASCRR